MGKLDNWIEYNRRHLSADMFAGWLGINPKIQAHLERQAGVPKAVRELETFKNNILKKVIGPGLKVASEFLAKVEKSGASAVNRTGTLAQAIGTIDPKLYISSFTGWIASGPRRGFARVITSKVQASGAVKLKRQSKKFTADNPTMRKADPVKYAGLVIKGHKGAVAGISRGQQTGKKSLMDSCTGKFFGRSTADARPKDFMASANAGAESAANMATMEMNLKLMAMSNEGE